MRSINIHEAKTHLSRLVEEAAKGDSFIIAKAGRPMVRVVSIADAPPVDVSKRIGFLKGKFSLPEDFAEIDRELDREIAAMFTQSVDRGLFPDDNGGLSDPVSAKPRKKVGRG